MALPRRDGGLRGHRAMPLLRVQTGWKPLSPPAPCHGCTSPWPCSSRRCGSGTDSEQSPRCPSLRRLWEQPAPSLHPLRSLGRPPPPKPDYKHPLTFLRGRIHRSTAGGTVAPPSRSRC